MDPFLDARTAGDLRPPYLERLAATLLQIYGTSSMFLEAALQYWVMPEWSFLTNHARVLISIAHDPGARLRDIATTVGITERSAYAIVSDLTVAGYVVKDKDTDGRRNRYQIQTHLPLPADIAGERTVGELLELLVDATTRQTSPTRPSMNPGREHPRIATDRAKAKA